MVAVVRILECRQHIAIGQAKETVRHAEPGEAFERCRDPRLHGIIEVEDHRSVGIMIVGE